MLSRKIALLSLGLLLTISAWAAPTLPSCVGNTQSHYLLTGFYYNGNALVFNSALERHKTAIQHLDILNYSSSLLGIIRNDDDEFLLADITKQNLITIHKWLKKNSPKTKLMVSLGHWSPYYMREIFSKAKVQKAFIDATLAMLKNPYYGISGIDVDWENSNSKRSKEPKRFPAFIKALRTAMNKNGLRHACLSLDLPPTIKAAKKYPAAKKWSPYIDWANLMAYQFYFGAPTYTELDGALGTVTTPYADNNPPKYKTLSLIDSLNYYTQHGVSKNKLVIALPFYGNMAYIHRVDEDNHDGLRTKIIDHRAMMSTIYSDLYYSKGIYGHAKKGTSIYQYTFSKPPGAKGKHAYWMTHFITESPEVGKFYLFISYPDPIAIKEIAQYAKQNNYLGLSSWQITYDLPYKNQHSLFRHIYQVMK